MKQITKILPIALILLLILFAVSCEEKQYVLEFKPEKGSVFKLKWLVNTIETQSMYWQPVTSNNTGEIILNNTVKADDTLLNIESLYEYISFASDTGTDMSTDTGAEKLQYNSNDTTVYVSAHNQGPLLRTIVNKPFDIKINKKGEIEEIAGFERIKPSFEKLFNIDEAIKAFFLKSAEKQYGDNALKTGIERFTAIFPDRPVSTDDSWEINTKTYGNYTGYMKATLCLKKIKGDNAIIDYNAEINILPSENESKMGGVTIRTKLNGIQTGTITININSGLPDNTDINQTMEGEIEISQGSMDSPIIIPVKQIISIKQSLIK